MHLGHGLVRCHNTRLNHQGDIGLTVLPGTGLTVLPGTGLTVLPGTGLTVLPGTELLVTRE